MNEVAIPTDRGVRSFPASRIVRIEAHSNYSKVYFEEGFPLTVAKVLHWFEVRLEEDGFFRIHKTHIVNRQFISKVSGGGATLTLLDGMELRISRRRREVLKKLFA